jgi:hypothetical protein
MLLEITAQNRSKAVFANGDRITTGANSSYEILFIVFRDFWFLLARTGLNGLQLFTVIYKYTNEIINTKATYYISQKI